MSDMSVLLFGGVLLFTQMQGGLTIGLTLSAIVFVLAFLSEGRAYSLVYWILERTGDTKPEVQESSQEVFAARTSDGNVSTPRPRGAASRIRHRERRDRIDIDASPALAHRDTREPELASHS